MQKIRTDTKIHFIFRMKAKLQDEGRQFQDPIKGWRIINTNVFHFKKMKTKLQGERRYFGDWNEMHIINSKFKAFSSSKKKQSSKTMALYVFYKTRIRCREF